MNIHYALQTCDIASNQGAKRYCSDSKTEIAKKCVTSFFESVQYAAKERSESKHIIQIFDDRSTEELREYFRHLISKYNHDNIIVDITYLQNGGIMNSIRACWEWLEKNGIDLVYQVQDDYLYEKTAIFEMVDVFMQMLIDTNSHSIVVSYNDPLLWRDETIYRYKPTPRTIIPGAKRYWMQGYDIPCTFMTSKQQFSQHWDLYEKFLNMSPLNERLEADTINHIMKRGVLCLLPITSVGLHMQSDLTKDPYIDWKSIWDSIDITGR